MNTSNSKRTRTLVAEYTSEYAATPYQAWLFPTRRQARQFMAREKEQWQRAGYAVRGSVTDTLRVYQKHNLVDTEAVLVLYTDPQQIEAEIGKTFEERVNVVDGRA